MEEGGTEAEPGRLPELRAQRWKSRKVKVVKVLEERAMWRAYSREGLFS